LADPPATAHGNHLPQPHANQPAHSYTHQARLSARMCVGSLSRQGQAHRLWAVVIDFVQALAYTLTVRAAQL